MRVILPVMK